MQPVLHSVVKDSFKKNNKSFYRLPRPLKEALCRGNNKSFCRFLCSSLRSILFENNK